MCTPVCIWFNPQSPPPNLPYMAIEFAWYLRVAKFACPCVLNAQKLSEDNQNLRSGCPPDYQIFLGKYFENSCPYKFFEVFILTLSFSNKHISFWELKTNRILYVIKMRATKNMLRTTRFSILVVLRLPTFDSNFATLYLNS